MIRLCLPLRLFGVCLFLLPGLLGVAWLDRWFAGRRPRTLRQLLLLMAYWAVLSGFYAAVFHWRATP